MYTHCSNLVVSSLVSVSPVFAAFNDDAVLLPTAPGFLLLLDRPTFDIYDSKILRLREQNKNFDRQTMESFFDSLAEAREQFKMDHIYPALVDTELETRKCAAYLNDAFVRRKDVWGSTRIAPKTSRRGNNPKIFKNRSRKSIENDRSLDGKRQYTDKRSRVGTKQQQETTTATVASDAIGDATSDTTAAVTSELQLQDSDSVAV
jgi:hypothetical protein